MSQALTLERRSKISAAVAASYRDTDLAERRAQNMREQWASGLRAAVIWTSEMDAALRQMVSDGRKFRDIERQGAKEIGVASHILRRRMKELGLSAQYKKQCAEQRKSEKERQRSQRKESAEALKREIETLNLPQLEYRDCLQCRKNKLMHRNFRYCSDCRDNIRQKAKNYCEEC